jgi:hypothetical protein
MCDESNTGNFMLPVRDDDFQQLTMSTIVLVVVGNPIRCKLFRQHHTISSFCGCMDVRNKAQPSSILIA